MATSPYDRTARDALARQLFVNAMATASNLGEFTKVELEAMFDQAADITLLAANRFQARALNTGL